MGKRKITSSDGLPPKRSKRIADAEAAAAARIYNGELYYSGPTWGGTQRGSGRSVDVVLLTDKIFSGSATGPESIPGIMGKLLEADGALAPNRKNYWKAGHLLNAELGGPGHASKNLTPLTATANSQHKYYETRIKTALMYIGEFNRNQSTSEGYLLGVEYSVNVSLNPLSSTAPYSSVAQNILIYINVVTMTDLHEDYMTVSDEEIDEINVSAAVRAALKDVNEVAQTIFNLRKP